MFSLDLSEFTFELKDGAIKHVGASNQTASAKLYDVETVEARDFGAERVKLSFEDDDGNEVQIALFAEDVRDLRDQLQSVQVDDQASE